MLYECDLDHTQSDLKGGEYMSIEAGTNPGPTEAGVRSGGLSPTQLAVENSGRTGISPHPEVLGIVPNAEPTDTMIRLAANNPNLPPKGGGA